MAHNAPVKRTRHFASDNNAGICPEAWAALEQANAGHASGYGEDLWTKRPAASYVTCLKHQGFFLLPAVLPMPSASLRLPLVHSILCRLRPSSK